MKAIDEIHTLLYTKERESLIRKVKQDIKKAGFKDALEVEVEIRIKILSGKK